LLLPLLLTLNAERLAAEVVLRLLIAVLMLLLLLMVRMLHVLLLLLLGCYYCWLLTKL
jgi:hypothetical protein